jgi:hypothetical protein
MELKHEVHHEGFPHMNGIDDHSSG